MLNKDIVNTQLFLKHIHHLSACTRSAYARDITALIDYCDQHQIACWAKLDSQQLRRFIACQHRRGLAGSSLRRNLSAIRSFFRYLIEQGALATNPAVGILAPKSPKKLPKLLDVDQAMHLAEIHDTDVLAIRDKAMIELLYSSGLRLAELVNLECQQLDLADATVTVIGKGNKSRIVPLGRHAIKALQRWLECRIELIKDASAAVFISRRGHRIHPRTVQQRLRYWAKRQLLNSNLHPHMLRHSFASHMLESSGALRAVQELLGHADISTTQVYTHLDFQHLAGVYDQTHPRARKKK